MNSHLAPKMPRYCVANLRNSGLLRAICALYRNILNHNLLRSDLVRGSLVSRTNLTMNLQAQFHCNLREPAIVRRGLFLPFGPLLP